MHKVELPDNVQEAIKNRETHQNERVELPVVTEKDPLKKHISILLITDGLKQVEKNLAEQEAGIKKYGEQLQQLQNMRIASIAQRNLLKELEAKIEELDGLDITTE